MFSLPGEETGASTGGPSSGDEDSDGGPGWTPGSWGPAQRSSNHNNLEPAQNDGVSHLSSLLEKDYDSLQPDSTSLVLILQESWGHRAA